MTTGVLATDYADQMARTGIHPGAGGIDASNGWSSRAILRQSTSGVTDIQFAPHYIGLQLVLINTFTRVSSVLHS